MMEGDGMGQTILLEIIKVRLLYKENVIQGNDLFCKLLIIPNNQKILGIYLIRTKKAF